MKWKNEPAVLHEGKITILGDGDPPPPPPPPIDPEEADIQFEIAEEEGARGEVVRLPIHAEAAVNLYQIRLVLGYDVTELDLKGFELKLLGADGEERKETLTADDYSLLEQLCEGEGEDRHCVAGFPILSRLCVHPRGDMPEDAFVVDLYTTYMFGSGEAFPGEIAWHAQARYEIGAVLFRIRDDAAPGRVEIPGVTALWRPENALGPIESESAGYPIIEPPPNRGDVPAVEVKAGAVIITGELTPFVRGDTDGDEELLITDPVRTLGTLFLGTELSGCEDAEDSNDDGEVNITDAIYTLQFLFVGGPEPPPPYPEKGGDPTEDDLVCTRR